MKKTGKSWKQSFTGRSASSRWNWTGLKKKLNSWGAEWKRDHIEAGLPEISIQRQCALLGLCRSAYYYHPREPNPLNLLLMEKIDEQYTRTPFYGSPKITECLKKRGFAIGHKRVERLMRQMGIAAVCPKKRLSQRGKGHKVYPYLLRDVSVMRPNQVWAADITYIRMTQGFVYLVAILDWFSRYVLAWRISNTLDSGFCLAALEEALSEARPEIFNSDQGIQFTSEAFTGRLEREGISISMDGRGRAFDNIFVERLWRTVKYEDVYLREYKTVPEVRVGLGTYFRFYNSERIHESLGYRTPQEVYFEDQPVGELGLSLFGAAGWIERNEAGLPFAEETGSSV